MATGTRSQANAIQNESENAEFDKDVITQQVIGEVKDKDGIRDIANMDEELSMPQLIEMIKERDTEVNRLKSIISKMTERSNNQVQSGRTDINQVEVSKGYDVEVKTVGAQQGNPIKFIPEFSWDLNDYNETKRFVNAFRTLSKENQWTETHSRTAFESKLIGKGRSKYFEGLGDINCITFNELLDEFEKLFSRELTVAKSQELFWNCTQGKGESVTSFKLRLVKYGSVYRSSFSEDKMFEQLLIQQFVKGLDPRLRIEVVRAGVKNYDKAVEMALKLEKCEKMYSTGDVMISSMQPNDIDLQGQINKLCDEVKKLENKLSVCVEKGGGYRAKCWGCGRSGHTQRMCKVKRRSDVSHLLCNLCNKGGHSDSSCYINVQRKLAKLREEAITNVDNHPMIVSAALEGVASVSSNTSGRTAETNIIAHNVNKKKKGDRTKNKHNREREKETANHYEGGREISHGNRLDKNVGRSKLYFPFHCDKRPCIDIQVNGRYTRALIDTGTQFSLISEEFMKKGKGEMMETKIKILTPFSDQPTQAQSTIVKIAMGDLEWSPRVYVSRLNQMFPFDFLFGYDLLTQINGVIDVREGTLEMDMISPEGFDATKERSENRVNWCHSFMRKE